MAMRHQNAIRVVKVGGSLLDLDDLTDRLRRWFASQAKAANVLVVGGGRRADLVRARQSELTDREAHWLAIETMEANSRWLSERIPEASWLDNIADVASMVEPLAILNPRRFMWYDDACHPAGALPESWRVTSDSIAARAAELAGAHELVLLKSSPPPNVAKPEQLSAAKYVDAFFAEASAGLARVRYVNLREF